MGRLIVMWIDPMHLSAKASEAWVRTESRRLLELDDVEGLELARLARASEAHGQPWDWFLEVRLLPSTAHPGCVDSPLFTEWLGDLRLLGMRPVVVRVSDTTAIGRDRD